MVSETSPLSVLSPELKAAYEVIENQKAQLRLLMDAYSNQTHWAKEWRVQCHDNLRLQAVLKSRSEGTEVMDLKRQLVDKTVEVASFRNAYQQRGILLSNAVNEVRLLIAENRRLKSEAQQ